MHDEIKDSHNQSSSQNSDSSSIKDLENEDIGSQSMELASSRPS